MTYSFARKLNAPTVRGVGALDDSSDKKLGAGVLLIGASAMLYGGYVAVGALSTAAIVGGVALTGAGLYLVSKKDEA
jgi:hypothetical protein